MRSSLVLFVSVALSSCSGTSISTCDSKCIGCCTADGFCESGITATACGRNGNRCETCVGTQQCRLYQCSNTPNGGGNDGGINDSGVNDSGVNDGGINDGGINDGGVCVPNCPDAGTTCEDGDGCGGRCSSGRFLKFVGNGHTWVDWTCGPNDVCVTTGWSAGTCVYSCDPSRRESCDAGESCDFGGSFIGHPLDGGDLMSCRVTKTGVESSQCRYPSDCSSGLTCDCYDSSAQCSSADPITYPRYCHRICGPGLPCPYPSQTCVRSRETYSTRVWGKCDPPRSPCSPNPCTEINRNKCSIKDGQVACGCNLGTHESNGQCVCTPQCSGKLCGPDGCGGTCGTCNGGAQCLANGICAICDPVTQIGCGVGERCRLNGTSAQCTTVIGTGTQGATCVSDSECAAGLLCTTIDSTSRCRKYCDSDDDCGNGRCAFSISAGISTCTTACNPLSSNCANNSDRCYVFSVSGGPAEVTDCQQAGFGSVGSICSAVSQCAADTCVFSACRDVCPVGSTSSCSVGTCTSVQGWSTYGICK